MILVLLMYLMILVNQMIPLHKVILVNQVILLNKVILVNQVILVNLGILMNIVRQACSSHCNLDLCHYSRIGRRQCCLHYDDHALETIQKQGLHVDSGDPYY